MTKVGELSAPRYEDAPELHAALKRWAEDIAERWIGEPRDLDQRVFAFQKRQWVTDLPLLLPKSPLGKLPQWSKRVPAAIQAYGNAATALQALVDFQKQLVLTTPDGDRFDDYEAQLWLGRESEAISSALREVQRRLALVERLPSNAKGRNTISERTALVMQLFADNIEPFGKPLEANEALVAVSILAGVYSLDDLSGTFMKKRPTLAQAIEAERNRLRRTLEQAKGQRQKADAERLARWEALQDPDQT